MLSQHSSPVSCDVLRWTDAWLRATSKMPWGISLPDPARGKSWSNVPTGCDVSVVPPRWKFPSRSFFFVSTLMTGSPADSYPRRRSAMFSNWAFRSG